jgi:4-deoxy-L-threo-5-hexosulose-uronate ketol-isomerase
MNTRQLREHFLAQDLMQAGSVNLLYTHYDRAIIGGAVPTGEAPLSLPNPGELKADFFLQRREIGIINVGGNGKVTADGNVFALEKFECAYLGMGTQAVSFTSDDAGHPAAFFLMSVPAHHTYPNRMMTKAEAAPVALGDIATSNKRTIYKYIHGDGIRSCQLMLGLTVLESGSVWNSVPPHTHTRRMEVYFYFDIPSGHRVMHFMGEPQETRHIVVADREAVVSPPWSMHFGAGTSNYGFIWGMAGENMVFTDMDAVDIPSIR